MDCATRRFATRRLMRKGLIASDTLTVNGRTIGENCRDATIEDELVIRRFDSPLKKAARFLVMRGNLFDSAIIPTSQTHWQEMQRATVGQMSIGAVLEPAVKYQHLA